MKNKFISLTTVATQNFGKKLASQLGDVRILALSGDLGAGKTTFIQGLANGLGIKRRIISPTFVIVRTYKLKNMSAKFFYHIDLYRMQGVHDVKGLGIDEIIADDNNIVAIEWSEKMLNMLPENRLNINFIHKNDNKREIWIEQPFK